MSDIKAQQRLVVMHLQQHDTKMDIVFIFLSLQLFIIEKVYISLILKIICPEALLVHLRCLVYLNTVIQVIFKESLV